MVRGQWLGGAQGDNVNVNTVNVLTQTPTAPRSWFTAYSPAHWHWCCFQRGKLHFTGPASYILGTSYTSAVAASPHLRVREPPTTGTMRPAPR